VELRGFTTDVFVSSAASWAFWEMLVGRPPDLRPDGQTAEWRLRRDPEIALRVRVDPERAGSGRIGLGVADVQQARAELATRITDLPEVVVKPGVIATMALRDPDGNEAVVWEDLLAKR
jgi:hypothetical protein